MKKFSLGTAVKSTCVFAAATICTQAFAEPEIYGQIRLSVAENDVKTTKKQADGKVVVVSESDRPDMASGNSRIGFKGTETLTENVDLKYRLEYKVDVADSNDKNFTARYGYIALDHKNYGELLVGRTISYDDNLDVSPGWWRNVGTGHAFGHGSDWASNSIQYTTPKFNNGATSVTVQYGMDEGSSGRNFYTFKNGKAVEVRNDKGEITKTGVDRDFVIVGASHETDNSTFGVAYTRAGDDLNAISAAMSTKLTDQATLGVMTQYTDYNSTSNELGGLVALSYQVSEPVGVWVEGSYADNYKGYRKGEHTKFSVGTTYDFNSSTKAFASVGYQDEKYSNVRNEGQSVEVGMIYKF